jgi:hypothetical protein
LENLPVPGGTRRVTQGFGAFGGAAERFEIRRVSSQDGREVLERLGRLPHAAQQAGQGKPRAWLFRRLIDGQPRVRERLL